jgi:hypothetical protein
MSDGESREVYEVGEAHIPLATRSDVRRALAKNLRRLWAGTIEPSQGHSITIGLAALGKMMVEDETTDIARRLTAVEERRAAH